MYMNSFIEVNDLDFRYDNNLLFSSLNISLYSNNCYIFAGLNGCGKSTLLKIIAGKMLAEHDKVSVLGKDPFRCTSLNKDICFINNSWGLQTVSYTGYNMPLQSSLRVKEMMQKLQETYPDRSNELVKILDINLDWKLNSVSEGQRKRVQLYLNLIQPFKICLLDEITVNLDLLVKDKFMNYLKRETEKRECCVIYVTHIFDGLEDWGTKLLYMRMDKEIEISDIKDIPNIYRYLLEKFKYESKSDKTQVEKEENNYNISSRNAGGYSKGGLVNLKYE